jgi:hypothetical protein
VRRIAERVKRCRLPVPDASAVIHALAASRSIERIGRVQQPYRIDANTRVEKSESAKTLASLDATMPPGRRVARG